MRVKARRFSGTGKRPLEGSVACSGKLFCLFLFVRAVLGNRDQAGGFSAVSDCFFHAHEPGLEVMLVHLGVGSGEAPVIE